MESWYKILKHFGITIKDFFWFMDSNELKSRSVIKYLRSNLDKTMTLVNSKKLPYWKDKRNPDDMVMMAYKWVCDNIEYKSDILNFGRPELWEDVDVIIDREVADCESLATLTYCLARIHNVNPLMLYFCVGKMKNGEGHAWLEYYSELDDDWYIVDPAYAPNLYRFRKVSKDNRYIERWYRTTFI